MNKLPHTPQKRAQKLIYIYITKRNKKQAGAAQAGAGVWQPSPARPYVVQYKSILDPAYGARRAVAAYASIRIPKEIS